MYWINLPLWLVAYDPDDDYGHAGLDVLSGVHGTRSKDTGTVGVCHTRASCVG